MSEHPTGETGETGERGHHAECYACPVGGLFLTARTGSPEAVEHLVNAASELVAAMRSVLEAAESFLEHQRGHQAPPARGESVTRIQRIDLSG